MRARQNCARFAKKRYQGDPGNESRSFPSPGGVHTPCVPGVHTPLCPACTRHVPGRVPGCAHPLRVGLTAPASAFWPATSVVQARQSQPGEPADLPDNTWQYFTSESKLSHPGGSPSGVIHSGQRRDPSGGRISHARSPLPPGSSVNPAVRPLDGLLILQRRFELGVDRARRRSG